MGTHFQLKTLVGAGVVTLATVIGSWPLMARGVESDAATAVLPGSAALIDQLVISSFVPESAFLLQFDSAAGVKKYSAALVDRGQDSRASTERKFLLGSAVPLPEDKSAKIYFTFFLKGSALNFSATPIKVWDSETLLSNSLSAEKLTESIAQMEKLRDAAESSLHEAQAELKSLRKKASQIAGVDEIIDLKMELARLSGFGEQSAYEEERLKNLIEQGRNQRDPADSNIRRQALTIQLQDTAQKTAMASRLTARRKEAARSNLEKKLALVREMSNYDANEIAREVLRLRNRNQELEARLHPRGAEVEDLTP